VQGLIDIVEHTGTEVFATIDVGDAKVIARLPRTPLPVRGQKVELAFNADRVLLFDVESRKSLLRRDSEREKVSIR
jgi:ABC-type sugar transport system ATPase subunit